MTAPATATGLPVVDNAALEVDDTLVDNDSTLGDGASSYATSLSSSVNAYTTEYGRRFHAHREKNGYIFPADQKEEDRLDMVHAMMLTLLDGKLHFAPIGTNPGRVIDLGTGTGNWAIEFADLYQSADVVGVDVSPLQPQVIPPNLKFLIDDIEEDWAQDANPFDYIHARYLVPQIKNWPRLVQQAFDSIKSGGWVEFQEWNTRIYSTDGTVTNKNAVKVWGDATIQSREAAGYDCSPGPKLEKYMKDAGFVNIQAIKLPIPLGTWPKDKKYKKVGAWNWHQVDNGLEGMAIGCLARGSGDQKPWTMEEITELCALARTELKNPGIHGQYDFYVVYGQKP